MSESFEEQIREMVKSGRISHEIADALNEHYSKQQNPLKGTGNISPQLNLMDLMNLIDLLEKKKEASKVPGSFQEKPPQKAHFLGSPEKFVHENKEEYPLPPEAVRAEFMKKKLESQAEELKKKYQLLETELEAEKKAHAESAKMGFIYAKRFADAEEKRRQSQAGEESRRKVLETENGRLVEEIKRTREAEGQFGKRIAELESELNLRQAQIQCFEKECVQYEERVAQMGKDRAEMENVLQEAERLRTVITHEKEQLEAEKVRLGKDLDGKIAEEARLWEEIQGREAKYSEKDSEVKAGLLRASELAEKHRLAVEDHEKRHQSSSEEKKRVEAEKNRLEAEKSRLEEERKTLVLDLAGKEKEGEELKGKIQAAGATLAKLKGEMSELEEGLKQANKQSEVLRSEKERLEVEKDAALKLGDEKASALSSLETTLARLKDEKEHLETDLAAKSEETVSLKARIREFEGLSEKKGSIIAGLEDEKRRLENERQHLEAERAHFEGEKLCLEKNLEDCVANLATLRQEKVDLVKEIEKSCEEKNKALACVREVEGQVTRANVQSEEIKKRCGDLEREIGQMRAERDENVQSLERLNKTIREMEALVSEKSEAHAALEEKIEQEKMARIKVQAHSKHLEEILLALEKKIDSLTSPSGERL